MPRQHQCIGLSSSNSMAWTAATSCMLLYEQGEVLPKDWQISLSQNTSRKENPNPITYSSASWNEFRQYSSCGRMGVPSDWCARHLIHIQVIGSMTHSRRDCVWAPSNVLNTGKYVIYICLPVAGMPRPCHVEPDSISRPVGLERGMIHS